MTESTRFLALLFAVLAIAVAVIGGWLRQRPLAPAPESGPKVGRSREAAAADPAGGFAHVDAAGAAAAPADPALERVEAALRDMPLPAEWKQVAVHGFAGAIPAGEGEEGPPWHVVLDASGAVSVTARLRAGRPGVPPGFAAREQLKTLHVAVEAAPPLGAAREPVLHAVLAVLCRRLSLGKDRVSAWAWPEAAPPAPDPALLPAEWRR
jgi:hypothetical protein